jgi:N-acetylneuraminate synthase
MMKYDSFLTIGSRTVSSTDPTYFIADIAANHDGDVERAKDLIWKAKEAGADCAKFQHFLASKIVSEVGFSSLPRPLSHQSGWKKPVVEIYDQYHTQRRWTEALLETCDEAGIDFMTTPYDFEAIDAFADIVPAYKIGSGDITFHSAIERVATVGKPVLLATGASDMAETIDAAELVLRHNRQLCIMQCNTNYTGSHENFAYVNINVLRAFAIRWPGMVLGLSDHTPGHSAVVAAVALGARVIEKHFTDDNSRDGPDHSFALNPGTWRAMVTAAREVELAMGDGVKRVEDNEVDTVVIQRRALRAKATLPAGTILTEEHLDALRPCPQGACPPSRLDDVLGRSLARNRKAGEAILWADLN